MTAAALDMARAQVDAALDRGDAAALRRLGAQIDARLASGRVDALRAARQVRGVDRVRDRRRFKSAAVPDGDYSKQAAPGVTGTLFPGRVSGLVPGEPVLKDGANNAKIGGDVHRGRLRGAHIVTLTLEERATCPRSCRHWRGCMGNGMQFARRWQHGPALEARLAEEIPALIAAHGRLLVRLHVLGDFYSLDYVGFWHGLLAAHAGLTVFGFTAHAPDQGIGRAVAKLNTDFPSRAFLRFSERTGPDGAFTLPFPTDARRIGDAIVCPEQTDAMAGAPRSIHCGNCGHCWAHRRPIAFVRH